MSVGGYTGAATFGAVVLAAGSGSRMKEKIAKQYLPLNGRPLIYYALREFERSAVSRIVLVVTKGHEDYCKKEIVTRFGFSKVCAVVPGGSERYFSVQAGLQALCNVDYVLIHDGARPFVDQEMLARTMEAVERDQAVVVGMPVKDTIKVVDEHQTAVQTPDRRRLWQVQTPQAFSYQLIRDAYDIVLGSCTPAALNTASGPGGSRPAASDMALGSGGRAPVSVNVTRQLTDDAQVLELAYGKRCRLIEGSYRNIKVTTPEDLEIAQVFCEYITS